MAAGGDRVPVRITDVVRSQAGVRDSHVCSPGRRPGLQPEATPSGWPTGQVATWPYIICCHLEEVATLGVFGASRTAVPILPEGEASMLLGPDLGKVGPA